MEVVDDVLRGQRVDEADGGRECRIERQVPPDVEQEPRLWQVLDIREPVLPKT